MQLQVARAKQVGIVSNLSFGSIAGMLNTPTSKLTRVILLASTDAELASFKIQLPLFTG